LSDQFPDISVVIPTFDRIGPLQRALESVLAQTLRPREILVVDDGSCDGTRELMRQRYPNCRYLYQGNRGVSSARNRGIEAANGDWIALLDSDDEWLPTKLATQLDLLNTLPGSLLCHTEEIWIRNGRRVNPMRKHRKQGGWIFQRCLPRCVISPSSALIHRSLLERVGLFDEDLPACEDYDLWLRICARHPVAYVETSQIRKYGGHPDQLSQRFWGMDRFRLKALDKIIASGDIHGVDLTAAVDTLLGKADILARGAAKRGRQEEVDRYLAMAARYRDESGAHGGRMQGGQPVRNLPGE
jgi:glycosyltransferase involved in cell wall biosynthesis